MNSAPLLVRRKDRREKGLGSVRLCDGKWIARLRWKNDFGQQTERTYSCKTQREAEKKLRHLRESISRRDNAALAPKFGEWVERAFEEIYAPKLRPSTLKLYKGLYKHHLSQLSNLRLSEMTPSLLERALFHVKPCNDSGEELSASTQCLVRRFLVGSLNHAVRLGLINSNPAVRTAVPSGRRKEVHPLSSDDLKAIFQAAPSPTFRAMFMAQAMLGLRIGEACGLKWSDIEGDWISIRRQIQRVDGKLAEQPLKTLKSQRSLYLPVELFNVLPKQESSVYIFASRVGGPIEPRNAQRALDFAARAAGVGHVATHQLRHSFGTLLVETGTDINVISNLMGHSSLTVTMTYAKTSCNRAVKATKSLASMLA